MRTSLSAWREAVEQMNLRYAVVTSVNRDDQPDGGSAIFARTIAAIRARVPDCRVEVLIPDFRGEWSRAGNGGRGASRCAQSQHRDRSAALSPGAAGRGLRAVARIAAPRQAAGAGDAGEDRHDAGPRRRRATKCCRRWRTWRAQGTDILTLGQYLQPTREHLPVVRFVHPDEFAEYKRLGEQMGFRHVESGPLVRSSYHAFEQEQSARNSS